MKKIILLVLLAHSLFAQMNDVPPLMRDTGYFASSSIRGIEISFDNDIMAGLIGRAADNDYTTGLYFNVLTERVKFPIPFLFGFNKTVNSKLGSPFDEPPILLNPSKRTFINDFNYLSGGLYFFTPEDLLDTNVIVTDRPYSSFQYLSLGRKSFKRTLFSDFTRDNGYSLLQTELQLGIMGGASPQSLQSAVHRAIGSPIPQGWSNQIGEINHLFVANYRLSYDLMLHSSKVLHYASNKKDLKKSHLAFYNAFNWVNVFTGFKVNTGMLMNDISANLTFSLFNFNNRHKYGLDTYTGYQDLVPSGSVRPYIEGYADMPSYKKAYADLINPVSPLLGLSPYTLNVLETISGDNFADMCVAEGKSSDFRLMIAAKMVDLKDLLTSANSTIAFSGIDTVQLNDMIHETGVVYQDISFPDYIDTLRNHAARFDLSKASDFIIDELVRMSKELGTIRKRIGEEHPSKCATQYYFDTRPKYFREDALFESFVEIEGRFVYHNAFLQGPLFYSRDHPHVLNSINPVGAKLQWGFRVKYRGFHTTLSLTTRTPELVGCSEFLPDSNEKDKTCDLPIDPKWHFWGNFSIGFNPSYLLETRRLRRVIKAYN